MKKLILLNVLFLSIGVFAQQADTVNGSGSDVFYNLKTAAEVSVDISTWDIGFTTAGFDASIIINESKGVALYVYSSDTNDWNTLDTNGFDFEGNTFYNSNESWELGAFANLNVTHPDYGWGTYDGSNHNINGSRLFIVNHGPNNYTQIQISSLTAAGVFTVKMADLGGANTTYLTFSKSSYSSKNFVYCSLDSRSLVDSEPASADWQLLFTKYIAPIQAGPDLLYYPVSGVKINKNLLVAERSNVAVTDSDTNGLVWTENITEIGYDWKAFNNSTFQYDISPDLCYFIKNDIDEVWKIWFTDYSSSTYYFNVEQIAFAASVPAYTKLVSSVYPSPANREISIKNQEGSAANVSITNLAGSEVMSFQVAAMSTQKLDISELSSGLYFVRLNTENKINTHKIIVR